MQQVAPVFLSRFQVNTKIVVKLTIQPQSIFEKRLTIIHIDMETKAKILFDDALTKLQQANQELYKPEEDVVSYSVCKNAQNAIESFLKGYLLQNGFDPAPFTTIKSLYEKCKSLNTQFAKINLSELNCSAHPTDLKYCYDLEKISHCLDAANNLDNFLKKERVL